MPQTIVFNTRLSKRKKEFDKDLRVNDLLIVYKDQYLQEFEEEYLVICSRVSYMPYILNSGINHMLCWLVDIGKLICILRCRRAVTTIWDPRINLGAVCF